MVTGDDNLEPVRQFPEPNIEVPVHPIRFGVHGEVARMDEQVAAGHFQLAVQPVGVAYSNALSN